MRRNNSSSDQMALFNESEKKPLRLEEIEEHLLEQMVHKSLSDNASVRSRSEASNPDYASKRKNSGAATSPFTTTFYIYAR